MRNLLVNLALPPTGLVLLILLGLLIGRRGRGPGLIAVLLLILLGMPVVSDGLLRGLEEGLPTAVSPEHPPQAIVVLGAEVIRAEDEKLGVRPGLLTLDRLRAAAVLQRRTGLPILVTGGTTRPDTAAVGKVMAQSLQDDFRVPVRWVEAKSADTWANARLSADILHEAGIDSVYVVTHAWHERRAMLAFRGTGLTVTAAPVSLDSPLGPGHDDFLPRVAGWQTSYWALHEWIGYAWYALR